MRVLVLASVLAASAAHRAWNSATRYSQYNRSPYFGAAGAWQSPAGFSEYSISPTFGEADFDPFAAQFPSCRGSRQSPINLDPYSFPVKEFEPFYFHRYHQIPEEENIINNGHSGQK
ncbi:uncharacterized protein LOC108681739 isoform X2 [Hyalella azteca]|uniref:Uncharacterized protein LOC108681739 isoform X2 n=1 Tax=Hyalella azteca TaxID=294128 RepID=A0A979FN58_HYAAZ|nr:uncharacterized protein LOC108681739 isoform X2 [Hyalella azteca]